MSKKPNFAPPGKCEGQPVEEIVVSPAYQPILEWSVTLVNLDGTPSDCAYQTKLSAGIDLVLGGKEDLSVLPGRRVLAPTGVKLSVTGCPPPMVALLELRSSLRKQCLTMLGTGVIDLDYKDEIMVMVHNADLNRVVKLKKGDRIAQLLFMPIIRPAGIPVKDAERSGGLGSTGK